MTDDRREGCLDGLKRAHEIAMQAVHSERTRKFIANILAGMSGAEAARAAGFAPKYAAKQAHRLINTPSVKRAIEVSRELRLVQQETGDFGMEEVALRLRDRLQEILSNDKATGHDVIRAGQLFFQLEEWQERARKRSAQNSEHGETIKVTFVYPDQDSREVEYTQPSDIGRQGVAAEPMQALDCDVCQPAQDDKHEPEIDIWEEVVDQK